MKISIEEIKKFEEYKNCSNKIFDNNYKFLLEEIIKNICFDIKNFENNYIYYK
jgi:hypothetical protein